MTIESLKNEIKNYNEEIRGQTQLINDKVPSNISKIIMAALGITSLSFGIITAELSLFTFLIGAPVGIPLALIVFSGVLLMTSGLFFGLFLANSSKIAVQILPFKLSNQLNKTITDDLKDMEKIKKIIAASKGNSAIEEHLNEINKHMVEIHKEISDYLKEAILENNVRIEEFFEKETKPLSKPTYLSIEPKNTH